MPEEESGGWWWQGGEPIYGTDSLGSIVCNDNRLGGLNTGSVTSLRGLSGERY